MTLKSDDTELGIDTLAVRAGTNRSQFNEHSEAMYLTSSFVFDDAEQAVLIAASGLSEITTYRADGFTNAVNCYSILQRT